MENLDYQIVKTVKVIDNGVVDSSPITRAEYLIFENQLIIMETLKALKEKK